MKYFCVILISAIALTSCQENINRAIEENTGESKATTKSAPAQKSIFDQLKEKVEETDQTDGLKGPFKELIGEDGTNAFDQVLKEISKEDAKSGGQVSSMIEMIIGAAEEEMGIDNMGDLIGDNLEKMNDFAGSSEEYISDLLDQAAQSGYTPDKIEDIMSGVQDFIKTGGDNGGLEKIMELVIEQDARENPSGSSADPLIDKLKEIVSNNELIAEKEAENILREIMKKHKTILAEASRKIN